MGIEPMERHSAPDMARDIIEGRLRIKSVNFSEETTVYSDLIPGDMFVFPDNRVDAYVKIKDDLALRIDRPGSCNCPDSQQVLRFFVTYEPLN